MIKPHKYLNLELSVINIAALVLKILMQDEVIKYDELLSRLQNVKGEEVKFIFMPTLNFLFAVGKISYHQKTDTIELVQ